MFRFFTDYFADHLARDTLNHTRKWLVTGESKEQILKKNCKNVKNHPILNSELDNVMIKYDALSNERSHQKRKNIIFIDLMPFFIL